MMARKGPDILLPCLFAMCNGHGGGASFVLITGRLGRHIKGIWCQCLFGQARLDETGISADTCLLSVRWPSLKVYVKTISSGLSS